MRIKGELSLEDLQAEEQRWRKKDREKARREGGRRGKGRIEGGDFRDGCEYSLLLYLEHFALIESSLPCS